MTQPPDWLTAEAVAAYGDIGGPSFDPQTDDNLVLSTATVKAALERRRSDLRDETGVFVPTGDVYGGAVMWAFDLYLARTQTGQAPGDEAFGSEPLGVRRNEIMRLVGWRRPVAV